MRYTGHSIESVKLIIIRYKRAIELGSIESNNSLGKLYASLPNPNINKAKQYYLKAAIQKNADAMFNLAHLIQQSASLDAQRIAFKYYVKAAHLLHTKAQTALGTCFYNGTGTDQDFTRAIQLYRAAAEKVCPFLHPYT